jgi:amino acid transporter
MPARGKLGFWQLFATSIGVVVSQVTIVALLQGVGIGGLGFLAALAVAFCLAFANAMAYAELALMMPSAGSLSSYAEAAIGNFPAILLVFAGYVTPALFGLPAELILANQMVAQVLPVTLPVYVVPVLLVVLFVGLNILGTDVFARVQTALSFIVLGFLFATGLLALAGLAAAPQPQALQSFTGPGHESAFRGVVALAFWVVVGSEFVTPLVEEARDPGRHLPRAMLLGLITVTAAWFVYALGTLTTVPRGQLGASAAPHLQYALAVYGSSARWWFAALAVIASASLLNTVIGALPRMLWGMANNGQVFPILKREHPRFGTPVMAIAFVGALPLIGLVWARGDPNLILPLTIAASVAWLFAYITAQVSLLVLRRRRAELPRPFRVPGLPWVPLLAIAGMGYVVVNSAPTPELAPQIVRYTGIVLAVFAVVGALWVKLVMKKGLFEPGMPVIHAPRSP